MKALKYLFLSTISYMACDIGTTKEADQKHRDIALEMRVLDQTENTVWRADETAIIICDMWDNHWCTTATERVGEMAPVMNEMIKAARAKGVTIVHAPSGTMEYYKDHRARERVLAAKVVSPTAPIEPWYYLDSLKEGSLPIDDSDGGCDTPGLVQEPKWSRQISSIEILDNDIISDDGQEIYNYFHENGIKNVAICGVHTNMCVLGRSFGVRGQVIAGKNVVLIRDLTDSMYNPEMSPNVSHKEGTNLVINHIEKHWCPTVLSSNFL